MKRIRVDFNKIDPKAGDPGPRRSHKCTRNPLVLYLQKLRVTDIKTAEIMIVHMPLRHSVSTGIQVGMIKIGNRMVWRLKPFQTATVLFLLRPNAF